MNLESITTSLEWSKKLKEAGWNPNNAYWMWGYGYDKKEKKDVHSLCYNSPYTMMDADFKEGWAAPTAEEILRELPYGIDGASLEIERDRDEWTINYNSYWPSPSGGGTQNTEHYQSSDTLANAAAAMFCYLSENSLLES